MSDSINGLSVETGAALGQLRRSRDIPIERISAALKTTRPIIEAIEADDAHRVGGPAYFNGFARRYAAELGATFAPLPGDDEAAFAVALPSGSGTPHSHYVVERLMKNMVYVVMTAAIAVPVYWLATSDRLPAGLGDAIRLDRATAELDGTERDEVRAEAIDLPGDQTGSSPPPVTASMAAFPRSLRTTPATAEDTADVAGAPLKAAAGELAITLREDSWLELKDASGRVVLAGLHRAGQTIEQAGGTVAAVTIGNAAGVDVTIDGRPVELSSRGRSNVARFQLSSSGAIESTP